MKMWWGPRLGRGDFFFALIGLNIAFFAALYFFLDAILLNFTIGLRSTPSTWGVESILLTLAKLVFDVVLISLCYRRLQDANHPGRLVFVWAIIVWALSWVALVEIAFVVAVGGLIALFVLKPTIGPNRFGKDPRGWKSKESFDAQVERLKNGDV